MKLRRVLFWAHLCAGVIAGCVILAMAITGVILAFQRQIVQAADSSYHVDDVFSTTRIPIDVLAKNLNSNRTDGFSAITLRSNPHAPVEFSYGRDRTVFVNPYTGAILGESHRLRAFFAQVENVHRWLGMKAGSQSPGHAVNSACNLVFLVLVVSGPFLWWPKELNWIALRKIILPSDGLKGRALFWNWHNVLGIWFVVPLLLITLSGVVMSYGWATNLVYRVTGNQPPAQLQPNVRSQAVQQQRLDATQSFASLELLFTRAAGKVRDWRSVTMRVPAGKSLETIFMIDAGDGGRPDLRGTLTLNRATGEIIRWEPFSSFNSGRKLRVWLRFTHTGEAFGIPGLMIAALASAGAAVLACTGLLMACIRFRKAVFPAQNASKVSEERSVPA